MAFGGFSNEQQQQPVAEINMIPLIDVMLVLLVIFIVAAPLMTHSVNIQLPQASSQPLVEQVNVVNLEINAQGRIHWDKQPLTEPQLLQRLQQAASQQPPPELRIHADQQTPYKYVATLMANASTAGLDKIGFVTEPK